MPRRIETFCGAMACVGALVFSGCGPGGPKPGMPDVPPGYVPRNSRDVQKLEDLRKDPAKLRKFMKNFIKNTPGGSRGKETGSDINLP